MGVAAMASSFSFVPELLKFGGLGVLALLCLVVLGQNAWNLNSLVKQADAKRITAARPLLLTQMSISIFGLLAVGAGAIFLERLSVEDRRDRIATVEVNPWNSELDQRFWPKVLIDEQRIARPFQVDCRPGRSTSIRVDFQSYVDNAITTSRETLNDGRIDVPRLTGG